jgi:hypothetical protein
MIRRPGSCEKPARYPRKMSDKLLVRPDPSEYAPHAKAYVDLVPDGDLLAMLSRQAEETIAILKPVEEERASTFAYAPGKWTIKDTIEHISDTERIFAYRALRIGRGDQTPLPGFEQNGYVQSAQANGRSLKSLIDEFRGVRQSTLSLFNGFSSDCWMKRGPVSDWELSVRGIAFTVAGHELHHFKILREKYLS